MPDIQLADEFRSLIGLRTVYLHQVQRDGIPYAGFEFGCTWEPEHGLGVLMHGNRTVKIGWAETACLSWTAEKDHDLPPNSLIAAPRNIPGWPPASRKEGWVKTSGEPLYLSTEDVFFRNAGAQFSIVGPLISSAAVNAIFPESFPGKDDLIQFYLRFNGGSRTPRGCVISCSNPSHLVSRNELEKLNLEGFRSIPLIAEGRMIPFANMLRHHATMARTYSEIPETSVFLQEHMEIAFDHSGRDLCINRKSGRIFFMDWHEFEKGPVEIASTFREFVEKFWNIQWRPLD